MPMDVFDFDTVIDRTRDASAKWARRTDAQKAAGIVPLSVADMEFATAPAIARAVAEAARHGLYGYTDADGPYLEAVAGWIRRRHGWDIQPEWIVPENGVVPALCVAVRAFTDPADAVLIQTPGYHPFTMAAEVNGRQVVDSPLVLEEDGRYRMDLDDLREKACDPRVKLMILCSPHNPVGRIWTPQELRAVADICLENGLIVVSDEIHFDLELEGRHTILCQAAPQILDRCVICTATSKTFNTAGLQLSNMIIPDEKLRGRFCARMNADGYGNVSFFGYHATIAAYTQGEAWLDAALDYIRANFACLGAWFESHLPRVRLLPAEGTYLAWTDWRALGLAQETLMTIVRDEALIEPSDGLAFGREGEGFLRLNLAVPRSVLQGALQRLGKVAAKYGWT